MLSEYPPPQSPQSASAPLNPPSAPFAHSSGNSLRSMSPGPAPSDASGPVSLSINYLPSKFSQPGFRKRGKPHSEQPLIPRGGGREAFRSDADRMPAEGDEDYDGMQGPVFGKQGKRKLKWNRFKWQLFCANILLSAYSLTALIFCLLTWFDVWKHADVVVTGNTTELIISTLAASLGIITSLIGWSGILLNNRAFLAVYTLFLWFCFAMLVTPGYITYKKRTFNLEGKINSQWSQSLGQEGRLKIQNQLNCCGYFSPFVEATISQTCYARSTLPGCKGPYLDFEKTVLDRWFITAFALVPAQLFVIITGLLCSNHITFRFGKGMMPKAYRLSMNSMAVIMDNYANQLAEQYGPDVATEVLNRSRSNLGLDSMPQMPYSPTMDASQNYGPGSHLSTASSTMQSYAGRPDGLPAGGSEYNSLSVDPPAGMFGGEGRRRVPYEAHTPPGSEYGGHGGYTQAPSSPLSSDFGRKI